VTVLPLSDEFIPGVLADRKTTTIRRGRRTYGLGEGVLKAGSQDIPIKVNNVRYCKFRELTEADAFRDGFESLKQLHDVLRRIYPKLDLDDEVTVVHFERQQPART